MATGNAVQRGAYVYVYNEKGQQIAVLSGGTGPGEGLKGYSSGTVNIQKGAYIYTYNEKGQQISVTPAR